MPYRVSTVFMIYDGGRPELEPAIDRGRRWIGANSGFSIPRNIVYAPLTIPPHDDVLAPWNVDWGLIPPAQIIFLFNAATHPSLAGATWGVGAPNWGHWRNEEDVCAVVSASYNPWWDPFSGPHLGFPTEFEVTLVHEWKNAIHSWLVEHPEDGGVGGGLGFSPYDVLNTYCPNEPYGCIDCTQFRPETERTDCYRAFLDQITPEMYEAIGVYVPERLGLAVPVIAIGGIGVAIIAKASRGRK